VNWEVQGSSPGVGEYILGSSARPMVYDRGETALPRYCALIRYADDSIAVFEFEDDARRFMRVLPKRLEKFGLRLNEAKTQLLPFGKRQACRHSRVGSAFPPLIFSASPIIGKKSDGTRLKRTQRKISSCSGVHQSVAAPGTQRS